MKKLFTFFLIGFLASTATAKSVENEMYFRAMKDEMKRTLKELRLPGEMPPYYVAYIVTQKHQFKARAALGTVFPTPFTDRTGDISVMGILQIGNNKNNNTGYFNNNRSWQYIGQESSSDSYEGIRQALWNVSNTQYLESIEQYKEKEAYIRRKNIKEQKPDVVPASQGTYIEKIPPWKPADREQINAWLAKVSAWGKEVSFLNNFLVTAWQEQQNDYYLNSRGAKYQVFDTEYRINVSAVFFQPDGYEETRRTTIFLRDFSASQLAKAEQEIHQFLQKLKGLYGAPEATFYLGPVLYKPTDAAGLLNELFFAKIQKVVPWWNDGSDEDFSSGLLRKKLGLRVMSLGITVYDRPHARDYEGILLPGFSWLDWEGVPSEELTLIADGRLKQVPLSQRPLFLPKEHKSNGHALMISRYGGLREKTSTIFVEPTENFTDEQMEEKLLARCKELGLDYCYIKKGNDFQRIYTKDGRKEWVIGLRENKMTDRSLRDILAVGGNKELINREFITPSLLVDEIELVPQDRKPGKLPPVARPE